MQNNNQPPQDTASPSSIRTTAESSDRSSDPSKQTTLQPAQPVTPKETEQTVIQVTSQFTAKPGLEVVFRQELMEYVSKTRANTHCKHITILTENGHKGSFLLHSIWDSEAAFIEHLGSPLVREYAIKNQKYGDPKLSVRRWTVLQENKPD